MLAKFILELTGGKTDKTNQVFFKRQIYKSWARKVIFGQL